MNQTHIHLMITHLPIFGSVLGAFVLAYGLFRKSDSTQLAAYFLFIISAIGAGIAYLTGESAEETVEHLQGISENTIETHEEFAVFALVSLLILGALSLFNVYATYKKLHISRKVSVLLLVLSFVSFGLVARTGYLGGQIRHSELASDAPPQEGGMQREAEDHD